MTIPSTPRRAGPFVGTGALVSYPFSFKVFDRGDVAVTIADTSGNETLLTLDSSVLVTANPDQVALPGGSVQYAVAGVATALPSGYSLTILSAVEYKQSTQLPSGGNYRAEIVEQALDALAVQIQQQQEVLGRALVFSPTDAEGSTLPPAANRADRLLGFDADGRVTVVAPASGSAAALALDLASTSSATKGDAMVGVKQSGATIGKTQHQINEERVSLNRWLTDAEIADSLLATPTLDVSAKVQEAVDWCLAQPVMPTLEITGLHRIGSPVNIDRQVDTTTTDFRISGAKAGAGFYVASAINIFSSTIPHVAAPVSEQVACEGLYFFASSAALAAYAFDGNKFLRMKFIDCYFRKLKVAVSTQYVQTWHFTGCQFREFTGWTLSGVGSYDCSFSKCIWEDGDASGGKGFNSDDPALITGTVGCRMVDNLFEGMLGPFVKWTTSYGGLISGNYFEANTNANIDLSGGRTNGTAIIANQFSATSANKANANFFEVVVGECFGLFGGGNYCDSRLYDFTNVTSRASVGNGEIASLALFRGNPSESYSGDLTLVSAATNTRTVTGQQFGAGSFRALSYNGTYALEHYVTDGGVCGLIVTMGGADLVFGVNNAVAWRILNSSKHLLPEGDNAQDLGSGSKRCRTIYAGTGTINTSDEREKEQMRAQSEAERLVALAIKGSLRAFKFSDAVTEKGAGARWHFGVGAQTVAAAFRAQGLDPTGYALFCFDEWPERPEVRDESGQVIQAYAPAGSRYGIRYDELAMFILAAI